MTPIPTLLTTGDVAKRFNVHAETIRRWANQGLIAAVRTPTGHLRFRPEDVESLVGSEQVASSA